MFAAIKSGLQLALAPSAMIALLFAILSMADPAQARDLETGVVKLDVTTHGGIHRVGSGFIVRLDDEHAYILTAAHVVEGAKETGVVFSARRLAASVAARVVGPEYWDKRGLALLVVSATDARSAGARPLPFGSERPPRIGTELRLIGHPRTVEDWSSLYGRVAARRGKALKIQAAVDEGSSGGPVLEEGRVVGIVVKELAGIAVVVPVVSIRTYLEGHGVVPGFVAAPPTESALVRLTVRSNVRDDLVYIDGKRYGPTRLDVELPPGTHLVRVEKEGYEPWETTLELPAGSEETVRATLQSRVSQPGDTFRDCDTCPQMVVIPAGSFQMGSPEGEEGRNSDEGPVHAVTFDRPFAMAKHEVTFAQWDTCVRDGGCRHEPDDQGWGRGARPVINVSWKDAREYVAWLSRKTGESYRLPSEAEWEYAARAGTETARFWGEEPDAACGYANVHDETSKRENHGFDWTHHACDDGYAKTAPTGRFAANVFGLGDMLGNVREWTEDCWNGSYKGAPTNGSAWNSGDCVKRVLRGGSWISKPEFVRSADRFWYDTENRINNVGFRPARTL